jgi:hypothetical protein
VNNKQENNINKVDNIVEEIIKPILDNDNISDNNIDIDLDLVSNPSEKSET